MLRFTNLVTNVSRPSHGALLSIVTAAGLLGCQGPALQSDTTREALTLVTVIDLGELGDPSNASAALDVNSSGEVVGHSFNDDGVLHAFFWTAAGGMIDLDPTEPTRTTMALALNEAGEVAGAGNLGSEGQAFYWSSATGRVEISLGGDAGAARDINDSGLIAGESAIAGSDPFDPPHAFLWQAPSGPPVSLGSLGAFGSVSAINNSGMVIGSRADSEEGPSYPFVWNPSTETFVDLSTLGGSASTDGHAYAINDLGQIVGYEQRGGVIQAMLWQLPGTSLPLGPLPGDTHSRANGINDAGQVVGISTSETQDIWHGFIWEEGVIQNVGDLGVGDVSQPSTITSSGLVGGFQGSNFDLEGLWRAYVVSEADGIVDAGSLPGDESAAIIGSGGTGLFVGVSGDPRGLVGIPGAFSNATLFEVELTTGGGDATVDEILDELVEAGTIEPGQHNALVAKLRAAENQLSRGNCTAAANQIRAFVSQVEALVAAGTLSADEGAALVTAAEALLAEAGC